MQTQVKNKRIIATFIGVIAPLLWSTYPTLTAFTGDIPHFQLLFIGFSISFLLSIVLWKLQKKSILSTFRQPAKYWAMGMFGIFGFNSVYILALTQAPKAEAFLLTATWPLLALLLGWVALREKLYSNHIIGCLVGFAGIYFIASGKSSTVMEGQHLVGYLAAAGAAIIWAVYSILLRRNPFPDPDFIGAIIGGCALGSLILHLTLETTVTVSLNQYLPLFLMGIGSLGISYYCWNYGVEHGDLRALSSLSYLGHFTTIGFLMMIGETTLTPTLILAFSLIIGGAFIGSAGLFLKKKKKA